MMKFDQFFDLAADIPKLIQQVISTKSYSIFESVIQECANVDRAKFLGREISLSTLKIEPKDNDYNTSLLEILTIIQQVQQKNIFYEAEIQLINIRLAQILEICGRFRDAVELLNQILVDKMEKLKKDEKIQCLLMLVSCQIQIRKIKDAQQTLHKIIHLVSNKQNLDNQQKYKYEQNQALINEIDGKYFQAASEYYNLSLIHNQTYDIQNLVSAILCGILDKAGPKRSALLSNIYKDPRVQALQIAQLLKKMVKQTLISQEDLEELSRLVTQQDQDKVNAARTSIIEHNVIAISQMYDNISINSLARFINLDYYQTLQIVEVMVGESRLKAKIDQAEDFIYFEQDSEEFSQSIEEFCNLLNQRSERLTEITK